MRYKFISAPAQISLVEAAVSTLGDAIYALDLES